MPLNLWPRKTFCASCTRAGLGCALHHGSIVTDSITGFLSLILQPIFPSGAFRGLYFSSVSLVERRQVATLPFRLGGTSPAMGMRARGRGRLGSFSWAWEHAAPLPQPSFCSHCHRKPSKFFGFVWFFFLFFLKLPCWVNIRVLRLVLGVKILSWFWSFFAGAQIRWGSRSGSAPIGERAEVNCAA